MVPNGETSSDRKATRVFEDVKVNVKVKLAALWIAVLFLYAYADLVTLFRGDIIEQIIAGEVIGIEINQLFLFGTGVLMAIPAVMIFLCLILKPRANRWLNMILTVLHMGLLISLQLMPGEGEVWAYVVLYNVLEFGAHLLILLYAWKWPVHEA
jgi:hypothetical protein